MNTKKKVLNNIKDYAKKVINCQDFVDYMMVVVENYTGSHKKARTETLSFANEPNILREAYTLLNATILTMEASLAECFNKFNGDTTKETFDAVMTTIDSYFSLPEVFLFLLQNQKDFGNNAVTLEKVNLFNGKNSKNSYSTSKEFFNSITYEYAMYFLKKFAYESARKVYGYIENYTAKSGELMSWKNECKMYNTKWKDGLTKPDRLFDTDDLADTDVLLGSVKIFMTAKMMSLLEE